MSKGIAALASQIARKMSSSTDVLLFGNGMAMAMPSRLACTRCTGQR